MFDIGWSEMVVIAVVALIVIGPRELPGLLHTLGKLAAKARATLSEFQQGLADMAREAELDELRKKIDAARDFDPQREIANAFDPAGEIEASLDQAAVDVDLIAPRGREPPSAPPPSDPQAVASAAAIPPDPSEPAAPARAEADEKAT